jgi:HlyD family secretion protein
MKRKSWLYATVFAVGLIGALVWAFAPRPMQVETLPIMQGRFEKTIDEDARTRLAERYMVSSPLAGRLSRITLHEGDIVRAGDTLAEIAPALPALQDERTLSGLQARVQAAQDNVLRASTRIERAKVALEMAKNDARRSEQLARDGFVASIKSEADRLSVVGAQRETESAAAERNIAIHDLEQAQAALGAVRQTGSTARVTTAFAVRSPVGGQVLRLLQTSEAVVALGTPLLELGDTARLEIVADLLTTDAMAAKPGSRVYVDRWGGATTLEGRVSRVEPSAFTKVSALGVEEQRVRVVIEITSLKDLWKGLGDGFRVGVRIVTIAQDDATQVPLSAVFPMTAGAPDGNPSAAIRATQFGVFLIEDNRAHRAQISLAGRNASFAWVTSGLTTGQSVIVYPPVNLTDGQSVRVRKL